MRRREFHHARPQFESSLSRSFVPTSLKKNLYGEPHNDNQLRIERVPIQQFNNNKQGINRYPTFGQKVENLRVPSPARALRLSYDKQLLVTNHQSPGSELKQTRLTNGEMITHTNQIIERNIVYYDKETGDKMMKVCTPRGTVKRIENLSKPSNNASVEHPKVTQQIVQPEMKDTKIQHPRLTLDNETIQMIEEATEDFSNPIIEVIRCQGCRI